MSENLLHVSDADFDKEVLQSTLPVLVDFWAEWCGPCRMLGPILEELAPEFAGKVKFVKLNVDESGAAAATYGVRGIPTLILFKNGKAAATKVGAMSKPQLTAFLQANL